MIEDTQPHIHDYAILGDGRSAALVSRAGSIDWLCWPRFDNPPIFARLLDSDRGGCWSIAPTAPVQTRRHYVDHTNVLETTFENADGRCVLVDLMTITSEEDKRRMLWPGHELLRIARCERGEIELAVDVAPRPDFGRSRLRASQHGKLGIRWDFGAQLLALLADVPLRLEDDGSARGTVRLKAGETAMFSLTYDSDGPAVVAPLGDAALDRLQRSTAWWSQWVAQARYEGPYRDQVLRSALVLKLMAFAPSGAIVAAPTSSLPERMGGDLNWDYRYCWLRDAAFTARAFLELGYVDEAVAFCSWLLHTTRLTRPELDVLYDVYGRRPQREVLLPGVRGYRDSRPVRIGNAAARQLQLDVYGEVIDATAQIAHVVKELDSETQGLLRDFGDFVCTSWREPDHGIWEPRDGAAHHTHSRLLSWVALDRLIELGEHGYVMKVDRDRYATEASAIRRDIDAHAWNPALGCYTGEFDSTDLDAAVLLMSWYGFYPADSPRMRSTYACIQEHLGAGPGLLYRYDRSLTKREGAFWICSFWAVEQLADGGGSLDEATALMAAACSYSNDVGLMAEEIDPVTREALGNFPQAYTHVGLINAALAIEERARRLGTHFSELGARIRELTLEARR